MPARGDTPGPLDDYRAKRNFAATPEPAPAPAPVPGADATDGRRFVIQEHHATALHWDLRLEHDGVLWSWALPRGVPRDPARNHLAVRTEDHPLEYIDFAGDIPSGNYGAGSMAVWDRGVYELVKHTEREVVVILHGGRVSGRHALFRTGGRNWMIHRMDPPADPDRVRVPEWIEPMQPKLGRLPVPSIGWSFEVGWGGHRVLTFVEDGRARVARADADAPDRADVTAAFGELRPLGRALGSTDAVLDGELVLLDADGRPDADALAERLLIPGTSRRRRPPVTLMLFDLPCNFWQKPCLAQVCMQKISTSSRKSA